MAFPAAIDLSTLDGTNGFRLNGIDLDDKSGRTVAGIGDINGDGFDDFIINAPLADPGGDISAGENYVVFGSGTSFAAEFNLSSLNGRNGIRIDGIDAGNENGSAVSGTGDFNGGGFDDVIIGADGADPTGLDYVRLGAGESYVFFGRGFGTTIRLDRPAGADRFRLDGPQVRSGAGRAVAELGDINKGFIEVCH